MLKAVQNEIMGDAPIEENPEPVVTIQNTFIQDAKATANTLAEIASVMFEPEPIETRLILPNLERLSISDLEYVSSKIGVYSGEVRVMIEQKKAERIEELRARLAADAAELAALNPTPTKTKKAAISEPSTPKYRDSAKPENTWAGRGKQPLWLKKKLEAGEKLEDFLIEPPVVADPVPEDTGF